MQVCASLQTVTMPAPHHSVFYRPDALSAAQPTASEHWRQIKALKAHCIYTNINFQFALQIAQHIADAAGTLAQMLSMPCCFIVIGTFSGSFCEFLGLTHTIFSLATPQFLVVRIYLVAAENTVYNILLKWLIGIFGIQCLHFTGKVDKNTLRQISSRFFALFLQCFDTVGWAAGRASGL